MRHIGTLFLLLALTACSRTEPAAETPAAAASPETTQDALAASVAGDWRSAEDRARDRYRHPVESLSFWGLAPGMTILEVGPGGGWWTDILAPYANATGGKYYSTSTNPDFAARFNARPEVYGTHNSVGETWPAATFDFVLVARSIHGWMGDGKAEQNFARLHETLKPGGILAVEQHRANPGPQDPKAASGYVTEEHVIALAQQAGFQRADRSEINANAADTKDHPFGVWTLPPTRRTRPLGDDRDAPDPDFDRSRYDAIGESDRMTLRFVKPG